MTAHDAAVRAVAEALEPMAEVRANGERLAWGVEDIARSAVAALAASADVRAGLVRVLADWFDPDDIPAAEDGVDRLLTALGGAAQAGGGRLA